MIQALKYSKLNLHELKFNENASPSMTEVFISLFNFDNIYSHKSIEINILSGEKISGKIIKLNNNDEKQYLFRFDVGIIGNEFVQDDIATYYETFDLKNDDNSISTNAQLLKFLSLGISDNIDIDGKITEYGKSSLLSSSQKTKVDLLKINQLGNNKININTLVNTKIGNIEIPVFNDSISINTFSHIFSVVGKNFNCKIKILFSNISQNISIFEVIVLEFASSDLLKDLELILNLSKRTLISNNEEAFLTIDAKFDKSNILEIIPFDDLEHTVIHEISKNSDIFYDDNIVNTTQTILQYKNELNILDSNFIINSNIERYTNNEVKLIKPNISTLFTSDIIVSLSNGKTAGKYLNGQTIPLIGKTPQEAFNDIFVETQFPNLTNPSLTNLTINQNLIHEIGTILTSLQVTATFNRGSISPQYSSISAFRSGPANSFIFTGPGGFTTVILSSSTVVTRSLTNYTVITGNNTFIAQTSYDMGIQPKDSIGNNFNLPLNSGNTNTQSINLQGVYPLFANSLSININTKQPLINMITSNNVQINLAGESGGNKQYFKIPEVWLASRPLLSIQYFNIISNQFDTSNKLSDFTITSVTEIIQSNLVNYKKYTYNGSDRANILIRIIFA